MKRTTRTWVAAATVGALLLAGCAKGDDTSTPNGSSAAGLPECPVAALRTATGPVEVLLWYQLNATTAETLKKQVEAYNASQTKVHVRAEQQGADYDELLAAYQRGIESKNLPDMAMMEQTALQYMVDSQTVLPGQACFQADKLSTAGFNQAAVNFYTVGGVFYPVTASLSNNVTYYNRNHFRKAGLDPEKAPATLDEVRAAAEAIKKAGVVDKPVILKMAPWLLENLLTGEHQEMVDNQNGHGAGKTTKATFDTPIAHALFRWIADMVRDGLLTPIPDTPGQFDHYVALAQQKASISVETSTAATSIKAFLSGDTSVGDVVGANAGTRNLDALDVGAGPLFGVTKPGRVAVGGNASYIMRTSSAEKQSAAWDFVKWWNQPEQQYIWHVQGSYLPFLTALQDDPRVQAFWRDDLAGRILKLGNDQFQTGVDPNFTGPVIGPYKDFRVAVRNAMDSVAFAKTPDADAAVTKAVSDADAAITRYNESSFK